MGKKSKWQRREDKKNARLASAENFERLAHRVTRYLNEECFCRATLYLENEEVIISFRSIDETITFSFKELYEFFMPDSKFVYNKENQILQSAMQRLDNFYQTDDNYKYFEEFPVYEARKKREKNV